MDAKEEIELLARENNLWLAIKSPVKGLTMIAPDQYNIGLAKISKIMDPVGVGISLMTPTMQNPPPPVVRRFDALWIQLMDA